MIHNKLLLCFFFFFFSCSLFTPIGNKRAVFGGDLIDFFSLFFFFVVCVTGSACVLQESVCVFLNDDDGYFSPPFYILPPPKTTTKKKRRTNAQTNKNLFSIRFVPCFIFYFYEMFTLSESEKKKREAMVLNRREIERRSGATKVSRGD